MVRTTLLEISVQADHISRFDNDVYLEIIFRHFDSLLMNDVLMEPK
jgi:hypothetical protein